MRRGRDPVAVARACAGLAAVDAVGTGADVGQRLVDAAVELMDVWAAGLLLEAPGSAPRLLAASSHETGLLESVQVESGQGPCLAAMEHDRVVVVDDVADVAARWPEWSAGARALGVRRAYGVPVRVGSRPIGALNVFLRDEAPLAGEDVEVLAGVAAVAGSLLLSHRAADEATTRAGHLQAALDSRVVVEQAKGRLAERRGIGEDEAFALLRRRARTDRRTVSDVARGVLAGSEPPFDA